MTTVGNDDSITRHGDVRRLPEFVHPGDPRGLFTRRLDHLLRADGTLARTVNGPEDLHALVARVGHVQPITLLQDGNALGAAKLALCLAPLAIAPGKLAFAVEAEYAVLPLVCKRIRFYGQFCSKLFRWKLLLDEFNVVVGSSLFTRTLPIPQMTDLDKTVGIVFWYPIMNEIPSDPMTVPLFNQSIQKHKSCS